MKRRDLLKNIGLGAAGVAVSGGVMANEPNAPTLPAIPTDKGKAISPDDVPDAINGRQYVEYLHDKKLMEETYFTPHEMDTIRILGDIIIPADGKSGSASDAGVPDFIEFIVKDMPQHQVPMRGGLMWLDNESKKQFGGRFSELSEANRLKMVDQIAYPEEAKPEHSQGVKFFNLMRNLTATGFFTSEIGVADLGYMGNTPSFWDGVPEDVLKKYNLSYADWEKHVAKNG